MADVSGWGSGGWGEAAWDFSVYDRESKDSAEGNDKAYASLTVAPNTTKAEVKSAAEAASLTTRPEVKKALVLSLPSAESFDSLS